MNINIVLSSVVLATVFSTIVSYIISRKQSALQYITGERKEWREKMRQIAFKLNGASYVKTLKILTELKVRINAWENNDVEIGYFSDAHIWKAIDELENKEPSETILHSKQNQLIEYISLLLKYDWERSKNEVKNNMYNIVGWIMFFSTSIYFTFSIFMYSGNINITKSDLGSMAAVYILLIIASNVVVLMLGKSVCKKILDGVVKQKVKENNSWKLAKCYGIWGIYFLASFIIYTVALREVFSVVVGGKGVSIILLVLMYMIGLGLQVIYQGLNISKDYNYVSAIDKIRRIYENSADYSSNDGIKDVAKKEYLIKVEEV